MKRSLEKLSEHEWQIEPVGDMRVPGMIFSNALLINDMDDAVIKQVCNVASLPGIVKASFAMPDAHWGYGFPIGGVAAFDPEQGGVVSAGGVGFDISCGVRTILTGLSCDDVLRRQKKLADRLYGAIPAGVGVGGKKSYTPAQLDDMLSGGAAWAIHQGFGDPSDLEHIEYNGCVEHACPDYVSDKAKQRQQDQMGTLGSGNHYLEVQEICDIYDEQKATLFGLRKGDVVVSIHCGSRGLGHQVATEYSKMMIAAAQHHGITIPDRELACAPIQSEEGQQYLGAMRAAINCALANRQMLMCLVREVFSDLFPKASLELLYDVSHNTCREEQHVVDGMTKTLFVHRKGATCAWGPERFPQETIMGEVGQPVLIGGTMGTASYILAGTDESMGLAFGSACHGAGRTMSRTAAKKQYRGNEVVNELAERGIMIRSRSYKGVAEEAPGAYKDVSTVVETTHQVGLACKVVKLVPLICVKG